MVIIGNVIVVAVILQLWKFNIKKREPPTNHNTKKHNKKNYKGKPT